MIPTKEHKRLYNLAKAEKTLEDEGLLDDNFKKKIKDKKNDLDKNIK